MKIRMCLNLAEDDITKEEDGEVEGATASDEKKPDTNDVLVRQCVRLWLPIHTFTQDLYLCLCIKSECI
jgi:hypothetical protein